MLWILTFDIWLELAVYFQNYFKVSHIKCIYSYKSKIWVLGKKMCENITWKYKEN